MNDDDTNGQEAIYKGKIMPLYPTQFDNEVFKVNPSTSFKILNVLSYIVLFFLFLFLFLILVSGIVLDVKLNEFLAYVFPLVIFIFQFRRFSKKIVPTKSTFDYELAPFIIALTVFILLSGSSLFFIYIFISFPSVFLIIQVGAMSILFGEISLALLSGKNTPRFIILTISVVWIVLQAFILLPDLYYLLVVSVPSMLFIYSLAINSAAREFFNH